MRASPFLIWSLIGAAAITIVSFNVPFRKSEPSVDAPRLIDKLYTEEQIKNLLLKASNGDGQAAMDLYRYYKFTARDDRRAMDYKDMAAKLGNQDAIELLHEEAVNKTK